MALIETKLAAPDDDVEGARIPEGLPPVIDAHVHLFPDRLFEAIWKWFEQYGWPIKYQLPSPEVVDFQLSRGVERIVALHYAHKPGIARGMNLYMAELCAREPRILGAATVMPGEPEATMILEEAFAAGLRAVKLHCHVQCFAPDADPMREIYQACAQAGVPLVMHAGREPKSPAYACDPYAMCDAGRIERVLAEHPGLKLCVPHLGCDEYDEYLRLLERFDNLWLDTTMMCADYFKLKDPWELVEARPERVMYGTDFPNIPYAWDRELRKIAERKLGPDALEHVLGKTARGLFGL